MAAPVVILSPHLDDAVLSCWHVLSGPADVRVINLFAGLPARGAAPGWWDRRTEPRAMVSARRAEDAASLALTGREPLNLPLLDRQYRDQDQRPAALLEALRPRLSPGARLLAPAALGPHPDHLVVRAAALERLFARRLDDPELLGYEVTWRLLPAA